ncbi:MAG: 50S ribosomal protein L11 methyltransferase [Kiritimatiellae bacterium]|nr:50S ribosomal protein L11 methyltransferase [Kiritimatiellia bacterium]
MTFVGCSLPEQFVNPLFEVFYGGGFALASYRDVEEAFTRVRIYLEDPAAAGEAAARLSAALAAVGAEAVVEKGEIADEDWRFAYRRHFKTEKIGRRLVIVPAWERAPDDGRTAIVVDPGMAFGTGNHETTRACLEYIDETVAPGSGIGTFLDMGCGSGILSIAAAKLGCPTVKGFDVDAVAVETAIENAAKNGITAEFVKFALGRGAGAPAFTGAPAAYDLVAANILGPLLVRFSREIAGFVGGGLIVSGILRELYREVLAAYRDLGFREVSRRTSGEWTTGMLKRPG